MKYVSFLFLLSLFCLPATAQFIGLNNQEIVTLKKLVNEDSNAGKLYHSIKRTADEALDQHPDPADTVVSEGHLSTDPKKIKTVKSLKDIEKTYALAVAYRLEGKKDYLKKCIEFITAWASLNQPLGDPINDTKFEDLFIAYDLVRNEMEPQQKTVVNSWLSKMADAEIRTAMNKRKKTSYNNWNSHRLKVIGCIAWLVNDTKYKRYIDEELPLQIAKNLLPDGSGIDFLERDALHYHVYTLEPLISLATILKRATGMDFYHFTSSTGSSVKKSVDFLIPFVTGEKTHGEYVNSTVAFDKKRADNKEPGFTIGADFKPAAAIGVLIQAAYFEPTCMTVVRKSLHTTNEYPTWQAVINAVKK